MYTLKQAAHLYFHHCVQLLAPWKYSPVQKSPGLWKHQTHSTVFNLCVADFGIKDNSPYELHHLINAIKNISDSQSIGEVKITLV